MPTNGTTSMSSLRALAEARLREVEHGDPQRFTPDEIREVVRDLEVYQVELEIQNDQLVEARDAVDEALARYRELSDSLPIGYVSLDRAGVISQVNAAGARALGTEPSQIVGRLLSSFVPPSRRAEVDAFLRGARTGSCRQMDACIGARIVQLSIAEVPLARRADESRIFLMDVTDQRGTQERSCESERLEAVGRVAGGIAHDFNNILTVLLTRSAFALAAGPDERVREDLAVIHSAAERAAALTRQLLTFTGRQLLRTELTDVNALIDQLVEMLRRVVDVRISLERRLAVQPTWVMVDGARLQQALMNLVLNARDAILENAVEKGVITIETAIVDVADGALPPGRYVRIVVRDTGAGISAADIEHVFEPFFTTKAQGKGTGIGLASVRAVIEQSRGEISVASEIGRGTAFTIHLPHFARSAPEPRKSERRISSRDVSAEARTVLVVDDEPQLGAVVKRVLGSVGYRVLVAGTGEEAIRFVESEPKIDLVITDVAMPDLSGPELATRLVAMRPELKIALMSGYPGGELERLDGVPVLVTIPKPFSVQELVDKVGDLVDDPAD